jgi:hypothetical protein
MCVVDMHRWYRNKKYEEQLQAHALFLKKDWLSPGLIAEIHRHFYQNEDICADTC